MKCRDYCSEVICYRLFRFEKDDTRTVQVKMKLEWTSSLDYFDFDTDIPAITMTRALAKEPWSRQFFQALKEYEKIHGSEILNNPHSIDSTKILP